MMTLRTTARDRATSAGIRPADRKVARKWIQLKAVEDARIPLGLKATSIGILRAMISFMRCDAISELSPDHHVVYASNARISERAHVSVATVERHIALLVRLGLIERASARNGKRWIRRRGNGDASLVSGLSLLPLSHRHEELNELAATHLRQQEDLTALRDGCLLALARLQEALCSTLTGQLRSFLDTARTILRRKPERETLEQLLAQIQGQMPVDNLPETDRQTVNSRGRNDCFDGHIDTSMNSDCVKAINKDALDDPHLLQQTFPVLCNELQHLSSPQQIDRALDRLADQLQLNVAWQTSRKLGPHVSFVLLGYLLERVDQIRNHGAYFSAMLHRIMDGNLTIQALIPPNDCMERSSKFEKVAELS